MANLQDSGTATGGASSTFFPIVPATTTYSNFGALTTTFTPASSCSHVLNQVYPQNGTAMSIYFRQGGHSDCYPGSVQYGYHYSVGQFAVLSTYFSPGYVCPQGWETVATLTATVKDEQAYVCCPTGWKWTYSECLSEVPFTVIAQDETLISDSVWRSGATETKTYEPNDINNWPVEIHYRPQDLPGYTGTATGTATSAMPTNTDTSASTDTPKKGGLSTGAKVGIGVAIPIVAIALLIGICIFFRRRARRRGNVPPGNQIHEKDSNAVVPRELPSATEPYPPGELPSAHTPFAPGELPTSHTPYAQPRELPTAYTPQPQGGHAYQDWAYLEGYPPQAGGQGYTEQTHYPQQQAWQPQQYNAGHQG